jgi:signal transduction histidine kinase
MLTSITSDARRVRDIVADLKNFARNNPSEMTAKVNLNDVVDKAVGLTANLINKSTRQFTLSCDPQLPILVGNAQRLEQVVINLVVNACQALPNTERAISVVTRFEAEENQIKLEFSDEGEGIDADSLKRITDPFYTTRREQGGTGLGLAITDRIVRDHGGMLRFESTPGKGTTVHVTFPLTANNHRPVQRES